MKDVCARLAKVISDSGLSYADLGKQTNIAKSSIQRYATGKTKKIPIDAVQKIASVTGSSASWILGWTDSNTQKKNDTITDIILRLRTDAELLSLFTDIAALAPEQIKVVQATVGAFKQQQIDHID